MKVINKTTKIIGIGGVPLLPGEEITVSEDVAASPMVQHFSAIGKIALEPDGGVKTDPSADPPIPGNTSKRGKGGAKTDPPADFDGGEKGESKQEGGTSDGSDIPSGGV